MSGIEVEHNPGEEQLSELGVRSWPTWSAEVSEFPWSYDATETCYILEGRGTVTGRACGSRGPPTSSRSRSRRVTW